MNEQTSMTGMTVRGEGAPAMRLKQIEARMKDDLDRMGEHYIDLGRCLNQAKAEGLVPHGQWEDWVRQHAQMNVRNAQRVMQAAREIDVNSPIARLDFSKVMALIAIPAGEREQFAAEVKADELSVRELQAAVKAKQDAEGRAKDAEIRAQAAELKSRQLSGELSKLRVRSAQAQNDRINELQGDIENLEGELKRRAQSEREAKDELLRLKTQMARGSEASTGRLTADDVAVAARAFLGQVDVLPHMRRELAGLRDADRLAYLRQIDMVEAWCERARDALNHVEVIEA